MKKTIRHTERDKKAVENKQMIRDYISENNIDQTTMGELLGIKRAAMSRYLSLNDNALDPPPWIMTILKLRIEINKLPKKYDKIKNVIYGVEGI